MTWPPFNRDDLRAAASTGGFDMTLPILIRRLIAETATDLVDLDMPGESGVSAGGFDGVASAGTATPHMPGGVSVWELSVGGNDGKANDDYSKRISGPPGHKARDSTYVEVILAPWTKARSWAGEKNKLRRWREVRAYNLDRVHLWLESAPATTAWLAAKLGRAIPGVRALEEWWTDTWIPSTTSPLGAEIVLAGRADSAKSFVDRIAGGAKVTPIGGGLRFEEAMAFVAAALSASNERATRALLARTLVVSDANSLERLIAQGAPLIILLSDFNLARGLSTNHAHQLVVLASPGDSTSIDVGRIGSEEVSRLLASEANPSELGYLARRSLLALRRKLAILPGIYTPPWANAPDSTTRRLCLVGSWRAEQVGDRAAVESIVEDSFAHVASRAQELRAGDDMPFLDVVQDEWYVVAREDAWALLAPSITKEDLRALETAALEVFGAADPVLALDPQERWKAAIDGVFRPHSPAIRRGLAEYVAVAGASDIVVTGTSNKHSEFARVLARSVFDSANKDSTYQLWASLSDVIGFLAEGAPEEFLSSIRAGLTGSDPLQVKMFQDSKANSGVFGQSSPHSAFLWALESLAWSPNYVEDVVRILVALDALDPGGELSNRPRASLLGILSVWRPQTAALLEQRLRCIEIIVDRSDSAAELLLQMIPDGHGWQMNHSGPRYRDWRTDSSVTNGEIRAALDHISTALAEKFEMTPSLALAIVPRLDDFGNDFRAQFAAKVSSTHYGWSANDTADVFEALRELVGRHLEYADAAWALSTVQLSPLVALRDTIEPAILALRHRWLFRKDWVTLGDIRRRDDYAAYEKELAHQRQAAVDSIFSASGLYGVFEFAEQADPWVVGFSLGNAAAPVERDILTQLSSESTTVSSMAAGYFASRLRQDDSPIDALLEEFDDPEKQAFLLRYLPDQVTAQALLGGLHSRVSEIYWQNFNYFGLGGDFSKALQSGWCLLDAGRPVAALMLNQLYFKGSSAGEETADLLAAALEALIAKPDPDPDPEIQNLQHYELERIFDVLAAHREHLGSQRVVALEWQLLPLSSFDGSSPALHAEIKSNPDFFIELIVACFRPETSASTSGTSVDGDEAEDEDVGDELTDQQRSTASRAWEVLRTCNQVPGVCDDGTIDVEELAAWIDAVRGGLAAVDRAVIGDLHIGEVLSHAPKNEDGSPFSHDVRDLLERLASDEVMRGIATGFFNSRGVTSRGLTDGGAQEWELADRYRDYASGADSWPTVRRMLEGMAERYEAEARRQDLSTERHRQGLR
ncbi:hypothetical protein [Rhodoglobus aureus]|uniref:Uncharacterized protein n=1 Tax=Rhodoglobus aureus TaxID=191497 RepID=A0ABN1VPA7_9MICO